MFALAAVAAGCSSEPKPSAPAQLAPSTSQHAAIGQLPSIDIGAILRDIKALSANEFEGRAPGGKGEELTVNYLVDAFKKIGLKPGNTDGSYTQKVPLVGITGAEARPLTIAKGGKKQTFKWKDDVVAWTKRVAPGASLENSELVFAGYGVEAPEFDWNDFKDVDVKGKTIVVFVNDPQVPDAADSTKLDPKTFNGEAMTYYGRWTYKFEEGAKRGAAGVLIVHETGPAGYPFPVVQGNLGEKFDLVTPDKNMGRVAVEGWITLDQGRKLVELAGKDFEDLKRQAASRDFQPIPLGVTASMTIKNKLRTIDSQNVIARVDGRDPVLRNEYVIYTAHWDHLGVGVAVDGDGIYNGAKDNAVGTAGLIEIARAFTKLAQPPKRSIVFLSVTAEEQGLLGSQYYSLSPAYPLAKTLANINMDGLNVSGRTKDLTLIGYGASDLDDYARDAAGEQGRVIRADPEPEKGFYYRSDHFNFAKQGVPALDPDEGVEFIGRPAEYGQKVRDHYTTYDYHKPSDIVRPDWDMSGAREDLQVLFAVGTEYAPNEAVIAADLEVACIPPVSGG